MKKLTGRLISILLSAIMITGIIQIPAVSADAVTFLYSGNYQYLVENGEALLVNIDNSVKGNIVIPSSLGGYPVTKIGAGAFQFKPNITNITVPEVVQTIETHAFSECYNLQTISLPASVKTIDLSPFRNCTSLKKITVNANSEYFSSIDGVLYSKDKKTLVYYPNAKGSSYTVLNGVTTIGPDAFRTCRNIKKITLPKGLKNIGCYAFSSSGITDMVIPDSVTFMDEGTFFNCESLKSVSLSSNLKDIRFSTFKICPQLTTLALPEGLTTIGALAFQECENLKKIYIPESVTDFNGNIFGGSPNVTICGIKGSPAENYAIENSIPFREALDYKTTRIFGDSRFETAVEISNTDWDSADTVVLANSAIFADALAGIPLASSLDAPILLTGGKTLESNVLAQIEKLNAKKVIILGGSVAISNNIQNQLAKKYSVERIAGETRYETSALIAKRLSAKPEEVIGVTGENFADAISVGPYAAITKTPIIYIHPENGTSVDTVNYILTANRLNIIGGYVSIPEEIEILFPRINMKRIYGEDRYETSCAILKEFSDIFGNDVMITTGKDFPDGLAGGVLAAKMKTPILLADPDNNVNELTNSTILERNPENLYVLGGQVALPDWVINSIF